MKKSAIYSLMTVCLSGACVFGLAACSPAGESPKSVDEGPQVFVGESTLYPAYSLDELVSHSNIVVSGEVVGFSEPFLIKPVDSAEPMYHTDMYVKVNDTIMGNPLPADSLTSTDKVSTESNDTIIAVRYVGGEGDAIKVSSDEDPQLNVGDRAMFFLYRIADGSDYNTKGNHYYMVTGPASVLKETSDGVFEYDNYDHQFVSVADVRAIVSEPPAIPDASSDAYDPNSANDGVRSLDNQLDNLEKLNEKGELSDADLALEKERAEQAKNNYAETMTDEEAA